MHLTKILFFIGIFTFFSCNQSEENLIPASQDTMKDHSRELSQEFKDYWYSGVAELTSYHLKQERYGEMRDGTAVQIFVTEDFLTEEQVKANHRSETTVSVLKLNQVKKFLTGIYPYSLMTSTFSPVGQKQHALKSTHSMQEWCGQIYFQLNNRERFDIQMHSYFEGEADETYSLEKTWLENEVWNLMRLNPDELPTGEFTMIPSFEFARLYHKQLQLEQVKGSLAQGDSLSTYRLTYPNLKRELVIYFDSKFPYGIERWEEILPNGMKTEAIKMKRLRTDYWRKHGNEHSFLRDSLNLN